MKRPLFFAALIAVLLLSSATRIINVSGWPLWTDEAWSIWAAHDLPLDEVINRLAADRHPPAYFIALNLWSSVAGDSRLALRFVNILAGVLTVAVTYRIGAATFGRRAGLYGALFLSVLSLPVYYSQEVRHYGWLTLAVALMSLTFLRVLKRPTRGRLIVYALSVAFMLYTQYLGVLLLAVQGVYSLLFWRAEVRIKVRMVSAWVLAGLLIVPWGVVMAGHLANLLGSGGLSNYPERYASTLDNLIDVPNLLFDGQLALLGGAYLIGVYGLICEWRERRAGNAPARTAGGELLTSRHTAYVVLGGAGLYAAMFVVNNWIGLLAPRGMVFLMPLLVVVCGAGIARLREAQPRLILAGAALAAIVGTYTPPQPRIAADAVAAQIAAGASAGDLVILEMDWDNYTLDYEMRQFGVNADVFLTWRKKDYRDPDAPGLFSAEPLFSRFRRIWAVHWLQPPEMLDRLMAGADGYRLARWIDVPLGDQWGTRFEDNTATVALFERVNAEGEIARFDKRFILHDALFDTSSMPGETVVVDLWWSALEPAALDYSAGVYLLDESGTVVAQDDAAMGDRATSQWAVDELTFDRHPLILPADLPPGQYDLAVSVYWYADPQPLPTDGGPLAVVGAVEINAG
ncbi:MAG: glycosyltransferase family 39 protein [Chloroflexi bacterium]|nr:glycosyltransferase family 39 protein [Chloroflexota bacterium]